MDEGVSKKKVRLAILRDPEMLREIDGVVVNVRTSVAVFVTSSEGDALDNVGVGSV